MSTRIHSPMPGEYRDFGEIMASSRSVEFVRRWDCEQVEGVHVMSDKILGLERKPSKTLPRTRAEMI